MSNCIKHTGKQSVMTGEHQTIGYRLNSREAGRGSSVQPPGTKQPDRGMIPVTTGFCSQHESYQNKTLFPISQCIYNTAESTQALFI